MSSRKKVSSSVIILAVQGDLESINQVLVHYDKYINTLCRASDSYGVAHLDSYMKDELKNKLVKAILQFKV